MAPWCRQDFTAAIATFRYGLHYKTLKYDFNDCFTPFSSSLNKSNKSSLTEI